MPANRCLPEEFAIPQTFRLLQAGHMGSSESFVSVLFSITSGFDIADVDDIVSCIEPGAFGDIHPEATHKYVGLKETCNGVILEFVTTNLNDLQAAILKWTSPRLVSPPEFLVVFC